MAIPTLTMIPSGYKAGTLYSVLPTNGDGDFTTSRSSSATRVNKSGFIETVLSNVPRLDYSDGSCPSLLLEPQSTNLVQYSEDFTNWSDTGVVVTSNATISPSGELNADKLQSTTNNWRKRDLYTATNGNKYSVSVYAKLDTSTSTTTTKIEIAKGSGSVASTFNLSTGSISGSLDDTFIKNVGNGWYRIGGTYVANGTNNIFYLYPSSGYGNGGTMFFWGAQVERQNYPTSYIPTNGSAVTRNVDRCVNGGNQQTFNDSEGVLMAEISALVDGVGTRIISIVPATGTANRIIIYYSSSEGKIIGRVDSAGTPVFNYTATVNNQTDFNKIALKYKQNDFALWINGIELAVDNTGNTPSGLNKLSFDNGLNASLFYGNVKQIQYFDSALTDAELQELTTI